MFIKNKKRQLDYRELEKKYNSLELNYEILIEKTSSELYKAIIDGDFELKYENDSLREQNKDLRKTIKELKQALRLLALFQKVKIDKKDFDHAYEELKIKDLGLSKQYCQDELNKFYDYLQKDGAITLKQIRKLSKLL